MILLLIVCAITDRYNGPPPAGLVPLALWITVLGIGASLGFQTGYAINPARDLGPRILTAMVGYGGQGKTLTHSAPHTRVYTNALPIVFSFRNQYWLWCPVIAPVVGALGMPLLLI